MAIFPLWRAISRHHIVRKVTFLSTDDNLKRVLTNENHYHLLR